MADPLRDFAAGLSYGFSDEPHPKHPTGVTEQEPWCHACSPHVTWAQAQTAARILEVLVPALELVGEFKCEKLTGPMFCPDVDYWTKNAPYTADRWCDSCIARDALTQARAIAEGKA